MSQLTYLVINIAVVTGPLLAIVLTSTGRKQFMPRIPKYLLAILPVAIIFILWDIYAFNQGHWDFNPQYNLGIKVAGIALEETMFFFTIPFALLFLYDNFRSWISSSQLPSGFKLVWLLIGLLGFIGALVFSSGYTRLVLLALVAIVSVLLIAGSNLYLTKRFWLFIAVQFCLFLIVNYVLTALPVITYGESEILGLRVLTIPVEDFVYSFVLTTACIFNFHRLTPDEK
jgi:lycopene cyclase domain-containing protein